MTIHSCPDLILENSFAKVFLIRYCSALALTSNNLTSRYRRLLLTGKLLQKVRKAKTETRWLKMTEISGLIWM